MYALCNIECRILDQGKVSATIFEKMLYIVNFTCWCKLNKNQPAACMKL